MKNKNILSVLLIIFIQTSFAVTPEKTAQFTVTASIVDNAGIACNGAATCPSGTIAFGDLSPATLTTGATAQALNATIYTDSSTDPVSFTMVTSNNAFKLPSITNGVTSTLPVNSSYVVTYTDCSGAAHTVVEGGGNATHLTAAQASIASISGSVPCSKYEDTASGIESGRGTFTFTIPQLSAGDVPPAADYSQVVTVNVCSGTGDACQ